jgi:hypothetical protein
MSPELISVDENAAQLYAENVAEVLINGLALSG